MAVKKTQLYASLWASCDKLRGGMDSSEYKDYILTLLFMKYVTDKFKNKGAYEDIKVFDKAHDKDPDPEKRTGCSFDDFIALKGKKNIGEGMDKIIARLADENTDLKGVIDIAHFNDEKKLGSGKEMVDKLTDLISIFQRPELDFSRNKAEGDDIIGDAYEYLMRKFATESGKSKGQFYTPAEVSRILANVVGISRCTDSSATVCDPACGSGSLLIRAVDAAPIPIMGFGQEKESTTAGLAKMNAVLHRKAEIIIKSGNTFSNPQYLDRNDNSILERFDYIVANPPFSMKNWRDGIAGKEYGRFEGYGDTPPEKNGDYAWLMHILKALKTNGKAAVILPHGVLFRGNAEATIREAIIKKHWIKGMATNQGFKNVIPFKDTCIKYLYYLLQTKKREMLEKATASTFAEISKSALCEIPLQAPEKQEQEQIAQVLFDIDALITDLQKLIQKAKRKFVEEPANMKLLIVVDKLLTGFDAPPCTYLYIDKRMQDHGLFQAICRVNRLDDDSKDFGYIVDYKQLFGQLQTAMKDYTSGAFEGYDPEDVKGLVKDRHDAAISYFEEVYDAVEELCEGVEEPRGEIQYIHYFCGVSGQSEESDEIYARLREKLYRLVSSLVRAFAEAKPYLADDISSGKLNEYDKKVTFYIELKKTIGTASGDFLDLKAYEPDMRKMIDNYITAADAEKIGDFDDLTLLDFVAKQGETLTGEGDTGHKEGAAEAIENNIRRKVIEKVTVNPR